MLPALVDVEHSSHIRPVSQEHIMDIYDLCVRPAITGILPGEAGHWPPSYSAEFKRAQRRGQQGLSFGTQLVPADNVAEFGEMVLDNLHGMDFGDEAFYLHEFRGLRQATQHNVDDGAPAIQEWLEFLDIANINTNDWWIDVGIEIQSDRHILMARKDGHYRVVRDIIQLT